MYYELLILTAQCGGGLGLDPKLRKRIYSKLDHDAEKEALGAGASEAF
jgi:hypothetical protein